MTPNSAAAHDGGPPADPPVPSGSPAASDSPSPSGLPTLGIIVSALLLGSAGLFVILAEASARLRHSYAAGSQSSSWHPWPLAILEPRRHGLLPAKALIVAAVSGAAEHFEPAGDGVADGCAHAAPTVVGGGPEALRRRR